MEEELLHLKVRLVLHNPRLGIGYQHMQILVFNAAFVLGNLVVVREFKIQSAAFGNFLSFYHV